MVTHINAVIFQGFTQIFGIISNRKRFPHSFIKSGIVRFAAVNFLYPSIDSPVENNSLYICPLNIMTVPKVVETHIIIEGKDHFLYCTFVYSSKKKEAPKKYNVRFSMNICDKKHRRIIPPNCKDEKWQFCFRSINFASRRNTTRHAPEVTKLAAPAIQPKVCCHTGTGMQSIKRLETKYPIHLSLDLRERQSSNGIIQYRNPKNKVLNKTLRVIHTSSRFPA